MSEETIYTTKIQALEKIQDLYLEISRITSQMNFNRDDYEQIAEQREKLLVEISHLQKRKDTLPPGTDSNRISEYEQRIKSIIMSIVTDTSLLLEKSEKLHASMKEEMAKISTANKAAKGYAAQK
ncbi:MAG: hypothetical protein LBH98_06150 [Chitinispirillales bacterium]|jgi:predicted  nucleic acid-binding Zn-ribbon protein|nr:hypothetical protein [Chitinispirillales bacterium]